MRFRARIYKSPANQYCHIVGNNLCVVPNRFYDFIGTAQRRVPQPDARYQIADVRFYRKGQYCFIVWYLCCPPCAKEGGPHLRWEDCNKNNNPSVKTCGFATSLYTRNALFCAVHYYLVRRGRYHLPVLQRWNLRQRNINKRFIRETIEKSIK